MFRFKLYFLIFSIYIHFSSTQISHKRLCIDSECSKPISHGKTLMKYFAPNEYYLNFDKNEEVIIYSKSAGSNKDLYGAEIGGKKGFIPMRFVRETKLIGTPTLLVDTEIVEDLNLPKVPKDEEFLKPSRVKEKFEVIDGTTIYNEYDDEIVEKDIIKPSENFEKQSEQSEDSTDNSEENKDDVGILGNFINGAIGIFNDNDEMSTEEIEKIMNEEVPEISNNLREFPKEEQKKVSPKLMSTEINEDENFNPITEKTVALNSEKLDIQSQSKMESQPVIEENENNDVFQIEKKPNEHSDELKNDHEEKSENNDYEMSTIQSENPITKLPEILNETDDELKSDVHHTFEKSILEAQNKHQGYEEMENQVDNMEIKENPLGESVLEDQNKHQGYEEMKNQVDNMEIKGNPLGKSVLKDQSEHQGYEEIKNKVDNMEIKENTFEKSILEDQNEPQRYEEMKNKVDNMESKKNLFASEQSIYNKNLNQEYDEESKVNETVDQPETNLKQNPSIDSTTENLNINLDQYQQNTENFEKTQAETKNELEKEDSFNDSTTRSADNNPDQIENYFKYKTKNDTLEGFGDSTPTESVTLSSLYKNPIPGSESEAGIDSENSEKLPDSTQMDESIEKSTFSEILNENLDNVTENHEFIEQSTEFYQNSASTESISEPLEIETPPFENDEKGENRHHEGNILKDFSSEQENYIREESPNVLSYLGAANSGKIKDEEKLPDDFSHHTKPGHDHHDYYCTKTENWLHNMMMLDLNSDLSLYLITTAISVVIFLLGYFALDKSRREAPLVAKINKLEHEYLILLKEKEILSEKIENGTSVNRGNVIETGEFSNLKQAYDNMTKEKQKLEEQIQTLEKELENSTEVGMELNKMLTELLSGENAGKTLMSTIEGLQAQLAEQQDIVKNMKETLSLKETENHELNLELDISNKKVVELQSELDKLLLNIIKIEEEKEAQEKNSQSIITKMKEDLSHLNNEMMKLQEEHQRKLNELTDELNISQRNLQLKLREYDGLKSTMQHLKETKNANTFETLVEVNSIKAELDQLKIECKTHCENLKCAKETNLSLEKRVKTDRQEMDELREKYEKVDKIRVELETKLEVLTNYFKDKETQLQKELSKYESMWNAKQGEATSTSEKIKYLQSEVQNYKSQNELLKQEIVSQEVELKSQISVLEKKVHENWVSARQAERRLEDLKHEAAQLRNRLTLRERAFQEDKARIQSPHEQNGEMPISPLHIESPSSPPLLYTSRDHITKSPTMLGMPPPPFLPPPPGAPFLPPPHLPFMPPPPPDMFPADHRPPPLGRMSSPPLNSRYSPDRRSYSTYDRDRRSPSPSYDESEYGTSPVHHRRYSPFTSRRDHRRKLNGRSGAMSSGSGNSNESLNDMNNSNV